MLLLAILLGQAFDVASIKRSAPDNPNGSTFDYQTGGGLRVRNGTLHGLIESAYDVRDFQVEGGPGWLSTDRYDLVARSQPGSAAVSRVDDLKATRLKLQWLLVERFRLAVHREMRELQEYEIVADRKGVKLSADLPLPEGAAARTGMESDCGFMRATRATMANMVFALSRRLRRPVLDRTGLAGTYTFELDWSSDVVPCPNAAADGPSLFTALQEKLGLKLESIKGPVETILVDRAERPSEN